MTRVLLSGPMFRVGPEHFKQHTTVQPHLLVGIGMFFVCFGHTNLPILPNRCGPYMLDFPAQTKRRSFYRTEAQSRYHDLQNNSVKNPQRLRVAEFLMDNLSVFSPQTLLTLPGSKWSLETYLDLNTTGWKFVGFERKFETFYKSIAWMPRSEWSTRPEPVS